MREIEEILKAYRGLSQSGGGAALATVVSTSGSTYRRPGAHMLIPASGTTEGTISGGCLENDLVERARTVMQSGTPMLVTYDSTSPTDIVLGLGLGCAGVVRVLLEPLPKRQGLDPLEVLSGCAQSRVNAAIAVVYRVSGGLSEREGARYVLRSDGVTAADLSDTGLTEHLRRDCGALLLSGPSRSVTYRTQRGEAEVFIEVVHPPLSLIVFGAGPDAVPLVRCGKELGWRVTLVDNRTAFLHQERFSLADQRVFSQPDKIADHISLTGNDVAVVMTHNFNQDFKLLRALFPSPVRYIGLLGPRSKAGDLLDRLREDGYTPTEEGLARFYNPVGLDIGAETPEEIALAIVAEIQAVVTSHGGGLLRSKQGPIHDMPSLESHRA